MGMPNGESIFSITSIVLNNDSRTLRDAGFLYMKSGVPYVFGRDVCVLTDVSFGIKDKNPLFYKYMLKNDRSRQWKVSVVGW